MTDFLIKKLYQFNLCTYFVLPLLRLNRFMLGEKNFVNCFVEKGLRYVAVELLDIHDSELIYRNPWYHRTYFIDGKQYVAYRIPQRWASDVKLFVEGRYSEFSPSAKDTIVEYSDLAYKTRTDTGTLITDARLMALDRSPTLINALAQELGVDESLLQGELLSPPKPKEFIELPV